MKLVTAIIKPFSSTRCVKRCPPSACGHHRHRGQETSGAKAIPSCRGAEYVVDFLPKVKIEAAIKSEMLEQVIEAIEKSANTGKIGDGKIFVFELEQVVRIRTGETGADAL
jgi:nitrogen regulatory protein P-II 2